MPIVGKPPLKVPEAEASQASEIFERETPLPVNRCANCTALLFGNTANCPTIFFATKNDSTQQNPTSNLVFLPILYYKAKRLFVEDEGNNKIVATDLSYTSTSMLA